MSKRRDELIHEYLFLQKLYRESEKKMARSFVHFRKFVKAGEFTKAKEYLRPMPESVEKIFFFREIIMQEDDANEPLH